MAPNRTRSSRSVGCSRQRGVVLVVTLITLLLVTLVTFAAARSSTVNMRIALAQEIKTATFQGAESSIMTVMSLPVGDPRFPAAVAGAERNFTGAAATDPLPSLLVRGGSTADTSDDVLVNTAANIAYRREAAALGNSIRKGGAGFQTFHYDVTVVGNTATGIATQTTLTQGIYVEAPRIN